MPVLSSSILIRYIPGSCVVLLLSFLATQAFMTPSYGLAPCPKTYGIASDSTDSLNTPNCIELISKVEPPIPFEGQNQNLTISLSISNHQTNLSYEHATYVITIDRITEVNNSPIFHDILHSHRGPLLLNIIREPINDNSDTLTIMSTENQRREPSLDNALIVDTSNDTVNLIGNLKAGIYQVRAAILGINNDTLQESSLLDVSFDTSFAIASSTTKEVEFRGKWYNVTAISYFRGIQDFRFDQDKLMFSWDFPFHWSNSSGYSNLYIHQELKVPKSFPYFGNNSRSVNATVNGVPIHGRMLAYDPYTSDTDMIFHYLLNKNDMLKFSNMKETANSTMMVFAITPIEAVPEFDFQIVSFVMAFSFVVVVALICFGNLPFMKKLKALM